jgi:hypothetical protein
MRAPATLLTAGLTATASLVLLTACGGSGDAADAAASAAPASSSSAAPSSSAAAGSTAAGTSAAASGGSSDPEVQAFCTQAESVVNQVSQDLQSADPSQLSPALDKAVTDLAAVQAPAEISSDWEATKALFTGLRDAVAGVDLTTQEGQAQVQQAATQLESQAGDSQTRLDAWTKANCTA